MAEYINGSLTGSGGVTTPGGSTTQVQYNNAGAIAGDPTLVFDNVGKVLTATTMNPTNLNVANGVTDMQPVIGLGVVERQWAQGSITFTSGDLILYYFNAYRTGSFNKASVRITATAAAGLTLARIGVYSVNVATKALTLINSNTNDTTGYTGAFSEVQKTFSAPFVPTIGSRYAFGVIFVGTTPPTLLGAQGATDFGLNSVDPRICGKLTAQADLPASIADVSIAAAGSGIYGLFLP